MQRRVVGFHTDEEHDWVADLDCGHSRHVRHRPPWFSRPWVIDPEQRAAAIGTPMDCVKCDRGEPVPAGQGGDGNHEWTRMDTNAAAWLIEFQGASLLWRQV